MAAGRAEDLSLNGSALRLTLSGGFVPVVGETFDIITSGDVFGMFAGGNGATFTDNAGDRYQIAYTIGATTLTVLGVPESGMWAMLGLGAAVVGLAAVRRGAGTFFVCS